MSGALQVKIRVQRMNQVVFKVSIIDGSMYSLFVLFIDCVSCSPCQKNTYHGNVTWGINNQTQIHTEKLACLFLNMCAFKSRF